MDVVDTNDMVVVTVVVDSGSLRWMWLYDLDKKIPLEMPIPIWTNVADTSWRIDHINILPRNVPQVQSVPSDMVRVENVVVVR